MPIGFNSILATIRTPGNYVEFDGSKALQGVPQIPHKALIIAPRLTTGTVAAATPFRINSPAEAETKFGRHSIGSFMGKAFKGGNPYTELWGIGVADNGGGAAAAGVLTIAGTATAAGSIYLYVAGIRIPVAIASGTTAAQAVTAVIAAAAAYELPVTLADGTGDTIDVTAQNKGTTGNQIDLRFNHNEGEFAPAGLTLTVTTPMAGGATDGSVSGAITALGDVQYNTIASAWGDDTNLDLIEAELLTRWGPMEQREGHVWSGVKGSQGTMTTAGNARNSFLSSYMGTGLSPSPTYVWAASVAAIDAAQCEVDPFRPRTTLAISGVVAPKPAERLTRTERDTLLSDGVSTFTVDNSGVCQVERLITTYQTTNSVADATYLDIMTPRGLAALRYSLRAMVAIKYPRHKLADDGTNFGPGQPVVTPSILRSDILALYKGWEALGWVENFEAFAAGLIVERDEADRNRVNVLLPPDLINALFVTATNMQFLL